MKEKTNNSHYGPSNDIWCNMKQVNITDYQDSLPPSPSPEDILITIEKLTEEGREGIKDAISH